ncbi:hypothetical protein LA345_41020 (plasmid) [Burkholderia vietnamiensis]|uniref:Uncharacterized protein n=1 Tax=Burkholderia vietnamiensis (strain G4 / LMG 22486) TaxID=269482 RepID=A4JTQ7_BURVG|nr:hypothetical protein Bcep1808_6772 [Burkholderia vietnamiensis G4]MCB4350180.1 hypothetical protein [Burkholderia vietnamiensis]
MTVGHHCNHEDSRSPVVVDVDLVNAAEVIGAQMYAKLPGGEVVVEPASDGRSVEIVKIMAGTEIRGDGTRAMKVATILADELGITLTLTPDGSYYVDEAAAEARLRSYYSRFGFRSTEEGSMVRYSSTPLGRLCI